jgi:FKBP-type peptidyl-prolyl cis-trans isomerase FklB
MKRIFIFMALAAMVLSVNAAKKPKKVNATTAATSQVAVSAESKKATSDSVSYAAGYIQTNGLIPYLQQQNVDTAYMADFIQGLKDLKAKGNDPRLVAYSEGVRIAQMINSRMIPGVSKELQSTGNTVNSDQLYAGFIAALEGDTTKFNMQTAEDYFNKTFSRPSEEWLKANKTKPGVVTTASGLQYKVITMGTGERPKADQEVEVKYEGHLIDGTEFDSSYKRNPQTTKFKCNQVIKGWTEGLQLMPVGSKFEFYIPQELAYGSRGMGDKIPPYSALIFTVELISVK